MQNIINSIKVPLLGAITSASGYIVSMEGFVLFTQCVGGVIAIVAGTFTIILTYVKLKKELKKK